MVTSRHPACLNPDPICGAARTPGRPGRNDQVQQLQLKNFVDGEQRSCWPDGALLYVGLRLRGPARVEPVRFPTGEDAWGAILGRAMPPVSRLP